MWNFFAGVQVSGDVVVGEVWVVNLVLFGTVSFCGFDLGFRFSRVVLSRFVTSSPMVGLKGHVRCGVWVSGMYV